MVTPMKALTIRQPWASLVANGTKTIETRSWTTPYRGPLAIHAGGAALKRGPYDGNSGEVVGDWMPLAMSDGTWIMERWCRLPGPTWAGQNLKRDAHPVPLGAVVAICTLAAVVPIVEREWPADGFVGACRDVLAVVPPDHPAAGELHRWAGGRFVANLSDQHPYGDFTAGRFAWLIEDVTPIEPAPAKGTVRLWDWTPNGTPERSTDPLFAARLAMT